MVFLIISVHSEELGGNEIKRGKKEKKRLPSIHSNYFYGNSFKCFILNVSVQLSVCLCAHFNAVPRENRERIIYPQTRSFCCSCESSHMGDGN